MDFLFDGIIQALRLIASFDSKLMAVVAVSLQVSISAILLAAGIGIPVGAFLASSQFRGRNLISYFIHACMSVPTVVIGLCLFAFLSRSGPLGGLGLMYTKSAMIAGQFVLALPIVTSLSYDAVRALDERVLPTILSFGASPLPALALVLREARFGIIASAVAGFARIFAEIGVAMMLGGNIAGYTRNITTAIALETGKGNFAMSVALGIILLAIAFGINAAFTFLRRRSSHA